MLIPFFRHGPPLSTPARTSASVSATSCAVRCGSLCATRLGTANMPARTCAKMLDHSRSTASPARARRACPSPIGPARCAHDHFRREGLALAATTTHQHLARQISGARVDLSGVAAVGAAHRPLVRERQHGRMYTASAISARARARWRSPCCTRTRTSRGAAKREKPKKLGDFPKRGDCVKPAPGPPLLTRTRHGRARWRHALNDPLRCPIHHRHPSACVRCGV